MSQISKELLDSIPPFLPSDVQLWFCLFESAMLVHKIDTEDLKFHILICSLPPNVAVKVRSQIVNRSASNPYTALRDAIFFSYNIQAPDPDSVDQNSASQQPEVPPPIANEPRGMKRPSETELSTCSNAPSAKVTKIRPPFDEDRVSKCSKSRILIGINSNSQNNNLESKMSNSNLPGKAAQEKIAIKGEPASPNQKQQPQLSERMPTERPHLPRHTSSSNKKSKNSNSESGSSSHKQKRTDNPNPDKRINTELIIMKPISGQDISIPEVETNQMKDQQSMDLSEDDSAFFDEDLNLLEFFKRMESSLTSEIAKVASDDLKSSCQKRNQFNNRILSEKSSHEVVSKINVTVENLVKETASKITSLQNEMGKNASKKDETDKYESDKVGSYCEIETNQHSSNKRGKSVITTASDKMESNTNLPYRQKLTSKKVSGMTETVTPKEIYKKVKMEPIEIKTEFYEPSPEHDSGKRKIKIGKRARSISNLNSTACSTWNPHYKTPSTVAHSNENPPQAEKNDKQIADSMIACEVGLFKCNVCKAYFGFYEDAQRHLVLRHRIKAGISKRVKKSAALSRDDLARHAEQVKAMPTLSSLIVSAMSRRISYRRTDIVCKICGKTHDRISKLNRHMGLHKNVCKYVCPICPASFKNSLQLIFHCRSIHDEELPFWCRICDEKFTLRTKLVNHHQSHHSNVQQGRNDIRCLTCCSKFQNGQDFKDHFRDLTDITQELGNEQIAEVKKPSNVGPKSFPRGKGTETKSNADFVKVLNEKYVRVELERLPEMLIQQSRFHFAEFKRPKMNPKLEKSKNGISLAKIKEETVGPAILGTFQMTQQFYENLSNEMEEDAWQNRTDNTSESEDTSNSCQILTLGSGHPETGQYQETLVSSDRSNIFVKMHEGKDARVSLQDETQTQSDSEHIRKGNGTDGTNPSVKCDRLEETVQKLSQRVLGSLNTIGDMGPESQISSNVNQYQFPENTETGG